MTFTKLRYVQKKTIYLHLYTLPGSCNHLSPIYQVLRAANTTDAGQACDLGGLNRA